MIKFKAVTIKEIESVWCNADFGPQINANKILLVKYSLLKWATGHSTGSTAFGILVDLGLITRKFHITTRGRKQLWEYFSKGNKECSF